MELWWQVEARHREQERLGAVARRRLARQLRPRRPGLRALLAGALRALADGLEGHEPAHEAAAATRVLTSA